MSQIHSVTLMPVAVSPPGNFTASIGNRVASTSVGASGGPLSATSSQPDSKPITPSEAVVHKSDGSSAVEVTISWGGGQTSTYEKSANAEQGSHR